MPTKPKLLALLAPALAWSLAFAPPQGGYTSDDHPDLGITLQRPRDYEEVPTQPDEEFVVLYYAAKDGYAGAQPTLSVVWIDWVPDGPATPHSDFPPAPAGDPRDQEPSADAKPGTDAPRINSLARYLEQRTHWRLGRTEPGKERDGCKTAVGELVAHQPPKVPGVALPRAWCYSIVVESKYTVAFIGTCGANDLPKQSKIWRYVAEHAKFTTPEAVDTTKLEAKYARTELRGIPYRVQVRSKLVRGWKAEDTENFIVIYHTPDQPLIRRLLADLEAIRKEYVRLFPPVGEVTAVSTVRVCKNRAEYLAYGGAPRSAGYWNSGAEELVFFDAAADNKRERSAGRENTLSVLYHEAFHQYIHYSAGELPPHSWFNEGHGDFFAGADISGTKVKKIGVFSWRIRTIQEAIERASFVRWEEIIRFEQPEYYRPDRVGLCYAQGWSMIFFLRTSPVVRKHPQWSQILDTYFVELKAEYARQLDLLAQAGRKEVPEARHEAGKAAREHAVTRAFADVNVPELQEEWAEFVAKIEFKD